jgi:hypothetical protein
VSAQVDCDAIPAGSARATATSVLDELRGHSATEGLFAETREALASALSPEFEKFDFKKNKKSLGKKLVGSLVTHEMELVVH